MMRMRLFSNDTETVEIIEHEDETHVVLHSAWEALHFVGILLSLRRIFKERETVPAPAEDVEQELVEDKPVILRYGMLKFRIA